MRVPFHAADGDSALKSLSSSEQRGLSDSQVIIIREGCGWNELASPTPESHWNKLASQFCDIVVWILVVAALVSGAMGEWTDTAAILAIVLLNALLGFFQEEKAERALAALQTLAAPTARVVRNGDLALLPARDLVPGDIVDIEAGDNVPADLRLLAAFGMHLQEASLTGESVPVEKDAAVVVPETTPLADRKNMAYLGTVLADGRGRGVVVATGMQTELGRIASLLQSHTREPTPLQLQLAKVGRALVSVCLVLVCAIFVLGLLHGASWFQATLSAVSLAVAAVPEGLPAVVTTTLALGLQRMVHRKALVRKLPSVETLGCVSVICSDKTGTLTCNELTVREVHIGHHDYRVTGVGYVPRGDFLRIAADQRLSVDLAQDVDVQVMLRIGAFCNHAQVQPTGSGLWKVIGDPTEGALAVLAMKAGIPQRTEEWRVLREMPFDSRRKAMSVLIEGNDGRRVQYTKGAPEGLLALCAFERLEGQVVPLTPDRRQELMESGLGMASRAMRVLALAYRDDHGSEPRIEEFRLTFAGLVGMIDPPREEVREAVIRCREAGIRPVMITGDHPATASAIASELGIKTLADRVVTGQDLDAMSDADLAKDVDRIAVYARVSPEHKLRVVRAWRGRGEIVAMTGDGVNDAPAVKAADIGIAMGVSGTDVTREASAMVLMDDNFASIVSAVEEGRAIYDNIQKCLVYLLSCNAGELLLMLAASVLGWPTPLLPVQLLWINLATDGLPALALAMEPPEPDLMRRRPRRSGIAMLSWSLGGVILGQGLLLAAVGLAAFGFGYYHERDLGQARTMAFCVVVFGELFRALAARSRTWTFWQLGVATNPYVVAAVVISALLQVSIITLPLTRPVFDVATHTWLEWSVLLSLALTPVTAIECFKLMRQLATRRISLAHRLSVASVEQDAVGDGSSTPGYDSASRR